MILTREEMIKYCRKMGYPKTAEALKGLPYDELGTVGWLNALFKVCENLMKEGGNDM